MSIEIAWGDEDKTILRLTCGEVWDVEDVHRVMPTAFAMLREVEHPVYVITDLRATRDLPFGIMWVLYDYARKVPPNWARAITITPGIGTHPLTESITGTHKQLTGREINSVKTEEEALALIERLKRCTPGK
jgi:hypothetical protein